jgi:hypothetical protein
MEPKSTLGDDRKGFQNDNFQNDRYFNQEAVVLTEIAVILFYSKNELVSG